MGENNQQGTFTDAELQRLITAFLGGRGERGVREDELKAFIEWAEQARTDATLLGLVLKGALDVSDIQGREVTFVEAKP